MFMAGECIINTQVQLLEVDCSFDICWLERKAVHVSIKACECIARKAARVRTHARTNLAALQYTQTVTSHSSAKV